MDERIESIEGLRRVNLDFIQSARRSGNLAGIKKLLTDLYPDNAHFIYELLQNAEDTHASTVRFTLKNEGIIFEHDGKKFTLKDVCSITKIGESTKPEDETKIGKFGVGFKAVFAYTQTPEVHSGDFHFRLVEMLIPETDLDDFDSGQLGTRFVFPFDHPIKKPNQAIMEINRTLSALGANTLLFLSHIHRIEYTLEDGTEGSILRLDHDHDHIEIQLTLTNGLTESSNWLRFQKEITINDGEKELKRQYAIAYGLKKLDAKNEEDSTWSIMPLDNGQVSIYFPAVKEPCTLRFHIHAPFASTVARDSVRDCSENYQLRDCIAGLVTETLSNVRDRGLLNMNFLATLPNKQDGLSPLLEPIREAIVRAFRDESFTPTRSGEYAPATALFRGPVKISEVIEDEDLSLLTSHDVPLWVANPPQLSQREDRFLDSLDIDSWDWGDLASVFYPTDEDERQLIERWVHPKPDGWLMRLYALLGDAIDNHYKTIDVEEVRLVRVTEAHSHDHVRASEAFFSSDNEIPLETDIRFVKMDVYNVGRSEPQKKLASSFLREIGVRDFDEHAVIELKLAKYSTGTFNANKAYYNDIKLFVSFWKQNPHLNKQLFSDKRFLHRKSEEGTRKTLLPSSLCLDAPYMPTGLEDFQNIHKKRPLCDSYWNAFGTTERKDLVEFLKNIGVVHALTVTRASLYKNPMLSELYKGFGNTRENNNATNDDYSIEMLEDFIEKKSKSASLLIWNAALKADPKTLLARYSPNQSYRANRVDSQLVQILKASAWIPDRFGSFRKPEEMTQDDLPEEFILDDSNGLLVAIGFGAEAEKKSNEYKAINEAAIDMGFESVDEGKETARLLRDNGLSPNDLIGMIRKLSKAEKPEESVPNPDRRRKGVLERGETVPDRESVNRERSIQPGLIKEMADARAYLRTKYTNSVGQLICQACHDEMPFKIREEHYYFEAIQCLSKLDKHFFENRLALCPTCAAMYVHARETADDELRSALTNPDLSETSGSISITVKLAGQSVSLYFVGPHWFDLKTVLKGS